MECFFKDRIIVSDPPSIDLIDFLNTKNCGSQEFCQEVLGYMSGFKGFYKIIERGVNGDSLTLKKMKSSKDSLTSYKAKIIFPEDYPLSLSYTKKKECLVSMTIEGKERRAEIKKEGRKLYSLFLHEE